jgi:hypothetical protein
MIYNSSVGDIYFQEFKEASDGNYFAPATSE